MYIHTALFFIMTISALKPLKTDSHLRLPLYIDKVPAGFPSPADDYVDKALDLNEHLIRHPSATFFCRVSGDSMKGIGIMDGDMLIVDRAIEAEQGSIILVSINGELTCKQLDKKGKRLLAANHKYPPIELNEDMGIDIEGVVICAITRFHVCSS